MTGKQNALVLVGLALIGLHYWFSQQRSTLGPLVGGGNGGRGVYGPMPTSSPATNTHGTVTQADAVASQATSAVGSTQNAAAAAVDRAPWSIGPVTIPFTGG